jgi:molecular chaperone DnaK
MLESLVDVLIERTMAPCRLAIKDAGGNVADIDVAPLTFSEQT